MQNRLFMILSLVSCSFVQSVDIFKAIESKNKKEISSWLKNEPNVELANQQNQTVLIKAVQVGNKDLVNRLLKKGAIVNVVDAHGKTALDYAVEAKNNKMAKILVKSGAMVTTEANAVQCKEMISYGFWKRLVFVALGCVLFCGACCVAGFGGFVVAIIIGIARCHVLLGSSIIIIATLVGAGGLAYGSYRLFKKQGSSNFYDGSVLQSAF